MHISRLELNNDGTGMWALSLGAKVGSEQKGKHWWGKGGRHVAVFQVPTRGEERRGDPCHVAVIRHGAR